MLLVLLGLSIITIIIGYVLWGKNIDGEVCLDIGGIFAIICVLAIVCVGVLLSNSITIDDKINLYKTENTTIETQIEETVKEYKNYEQNTFEKIKGNVSALITLYPELKSDELVKKQIDTYVKNNNKIKSLKEEKIDMKIYKWWLYFGG